MSGRGDRPVRVRIDVLSLPAGSAARGAAIGEALRTELARTLGSAQAQRELRSFAARALDAGSLSPRPAERAGALGTRIGARIASGLLGGSQPRGRR